MPAETAAPLDAHPADGAPAAVAVRGVRLTALLDRATLAASGKNDGQHAVVVASATDGYAVAFSWPALFDTDVGAGMRVVYERDGQPPADREGRSALCSAEDPPERPAQRPLAVEDRRAHAGAVSPAQACATATSTA